MRLLMGMCPNLPNSSCPATFSPALPLRRKRKPHGICFQKKKKKKTKQCRSTEQVGSSLCPWTQEGCSYFCSNSPAGWAHMCLVYEGLFLLPNSAVTSLRVRDEPQASLPPPEPSTSGDVEEPWKTASNLATESRRCHQRISDGISAKWSNLLEPWFLFPFRCKMGIMPSIV